MTTQHWESEFSSSSRLQVLLHFQWCYDLLFILCLVFIWWYKFRWIKDAPVFFLFFFTDLLICFVIEPARLYHGYCGNLTEQVPQLFLYLVLTFFSIAILVFLLVLESVADIVCPVEPCVLSIEYACWVLQLFLHILGLIEGYRAFNLSDTLQIQRFQLMDFQQAGAAAHKKAT